jgi:hypothetical protein
MMMMIIIIIIIITTVIAYYKKVINVNVSGSEYVNVLALIIIIISLFFYRGAS